LEKVTKGAKVLVTGRLAPDNYEKDDGTRVERIQIILNEWQLLDPVDKAAKSSKDAKGGKAAKQTVPPSEEEEEEAPF
jgi:single-stranded DNA-binding protein